MADQKKDFRSIEDFEQLTWWQIWLRILIKPTKFNFERAIGDERHSIGTAILWVAVATLVGAVIGQLVTTADSLLSLTDRLLNVLIDSVSASLVAVAIMLILTLITHLVARWQKGKGEFSDLAYVFSTFLAPTFFLLTVITIWPILTFVSFIIMAYWILAQISATQAVEEVDLWPSAISVMAGYLILVPLVIFITYLLRNSELF